MKRPNKEEQAKAAEREAAKGKGPPKPTLDGLLRNANDLQTKTFDPLRWTVPDILPEGLTMLAGRPKVGKSWLGLDMAIAVASGGSCLGKRCEQGDVLGLFLEDNDRRLQRRMTTMLGAQKEEWPKRLLYATEWPKLTDGGIELMQQWMANAKKPRLIIVDILERVRPRAGNSQQTQYSGDYEALTAMHKLASEAGIAVLVLHHQRKAAADDLMDTLSGTGGLGGAVDAVLILGKDTAGKFVYGRGRDLEEFNVLVQQNSNCRWSNLGQRPAEQSSPERTLIVAALAKAGRPMTVSEITNAVGMKPINCKNLLGKMYHEGEIERVTTGVYRLPDPQADMPI